MAVRLDQIQSDINTRAIRLSEIPDAILTPDEIEALANKEFDYADKERVTLREAQRKVSEQMMDENRRRNLIEINKVFGTSFDTAYKGPKPTLTQGVDLDKFTVGEKIHEAAKAIQRGSGQVVKLPGVALKAIGELPYNRQEIQDKKRSDWALQRIHGAYLDSKMGKSIRKGFDMIRRAGNAYIDKVNSMTLQPSAETKAQLEQPFTSAPIFRTALAVGESAPSYGTAIAATLTTGNPWAGLAVIGTTTAGSSYDNLRSMGVDPDLALVGAAIEGSIEVATEKIPMDELMKGGARPLLVRALRLGTMESFQELFSQMGQNYVDAVVKDTDPKDYSTLLKAARQEWQTIINGWEDAMAAGFIMGGGASMFSPSPETYMSKQDMVDEFGILPQQDQAFLSKLQEIREKVNVISEQAQQEIKEAKKPEAAKQIESDKPIIVGAVKPSGYDNVIRLEFDINGKVPTAEEIKIQFTKDYADVEVQEFTTDMTSAVRGTKVYQISVKDKSGVGNTDLAGKLYNEVLGLPDYYMSKTSTETKSTLEESYKDVYEYGMNKILDIKNTQNKPLPEQENPAEPVVEDAPQLEQPTDNPESEMEAPGAEEAPPLPTEDLTEINVEQPKQRTGKVSLFRDKIVDNKTLDSIGNQIAKHLGVNEKIIWHFVDARDYQKTTRELLSSMELPESEARYIIKVLKEGGVGGVSGKIGNENHVIIIRSNNKSGYLESITPGFAGRKIGIEMPSQSALKRAIVHELGHIAVPIKGGDSVSHNEEFVKWVENGIKSLYTNNTSDSTADSVNETEPSVQEPQKPDKGLLSKLTDDEYSELEKLEKQFRDKISTQLRTGLDPELFILATRIGSYYVRAGYRSFAQWASQAKDRVGNISNYTLRTVYANLRNEYPDLDPDTAIDEVMVLGDEIGDGEEEVRSLPKSTLALAVEKELVRENEELYGSLPTYQKMSMAVQAEKATRLIESDLNRAKRIAFYQEAAPPDLFPENIFTALRVYATANGDVDLMMELAFNEKAATVATTLGKRIKSLDTGEEYADPIRAIREVVEARKEAMAKRGKDVSALEAKLRDLQAQLESTQRKFNEYVQQAQTKAKREYGSKNTLVTKVEYEEIVARRKREAAQLRRGKRLGAAYVPTPQDFSDLAKIGMYHLEALGRDFAKWSFKVTKDLGDWVAPHLQGQYDKLIQEAEAKGNPIPESKRLTAKKKRLATGISKTEQKFDEIDFAKEPQLDIELDEEGQKLQSAYDIAKAKLKAAQETANIITEEEVRIIAQLAQEVAKRKQTMENSTRRAENEPATKIEMEYGVSVFTFLEYINDLKAKAAKKSVSETIQNYLTNPVDFITDLAGTMKAAKASLDNSFHGRQGLITLIKGLTGDIASGKIWWDTFWKSWGMMKQAMQGKKVMAPLFAEMVSDPEYELLKKSKVALFSIEEEIPVDIPSKLPLVGVLFRMGENAFVGSSHYMRYKLAKNYFRIWRKSGVELTTRELESIGRLANSQTGRGDSLSKSQKPGLLNNLFWSPRNLRAYVDILTIHAFDREFSAMARKQAAINLIRYISGAAFILALADWIDDDSVTWEPTSSDFGKIKVGNSRFSVGGGAAVLVVLAARLVKRSYISSTTGEEKSLDSGKYGALEGRDLVFDFLENKLSPAAAMALAVINNKSWDGDKLTVPQMANDALTPMIIQNAIETGNVEDSANILAVLIAEAIGVGVQTYSPKEPKGKKKQEGFKAW